jgi:hypothetical protein
MNAGDPGVRGPVSAVRIIGPDASQVSRHDLVRVLLSRQEQFIVECYLTAARATVTDHVHPPEQQELNK